MSNMVSRRAAKTAAAILFTACTGSLGVALPASAAGITLTVWHNSGDPKAVLDLYKAYEAASGNTIELVDIPADTFPTATQVKWATGDRPDIMEFMSTQQDMRQLNAHENMQDLSGLSFVDKANVKGELDGKVYAAVLGPISSFGAFYNKDVLKKASVDVPSSYNDLLESCPAIREAGAVPVFVGAGSEFPSNMIAGFAYMADYNKDNAYGESIRNGEAMVNDPDGPIVASLTMIDTLRENGCFNQDVATATFQDALKAVYEGEAALTILPSDFLAMFYQMGNGDKEAVDALIGLTAVSAEAGIPSYSASPYATFFAPKTGDAEHEAAALEFIEWVTTEGYQGYVDNAQSIPTISTAKAPDLTGLPADLAVMLQNPEATPAFNQSIPGFGSFGKLSTTVVIGASTPQKAADQWNIFVQQARQAMQN